MEDNTKVILLTQDGGRVETFVKAAKLLPTIKEMFETLAPDNIGPVIQVGPIPIWHETLKKIVEWLEHNVDTPQPTLEEIKEKLVESISQWDQEFLEMTLNELFDLYLAANYLNIPGLLWLLTRAINDKIKGKSIGVIFTLLGFSDENIEQSSIENLLASLQIN